MKKIIIMLVAIIIITGWLACFFAWRAGYEKGRDRGWTECIEENNLYERYYYENN